jgi:hypothetical protein
VELLIQLQVEVEELVQLVMLQDQVVLEVVGLIVVHLLFLLELEEQVMLVDMIQLKVIQVVQHLLLVLTIEVQVQEVVELVVQEMILQHLNLQVVL